MCRFGQGIIPLPNPVMSRYEWPCLRAYAGRSTLISDLDKHERTNRQKWLAQERMRLIVAEAGCALQAPPDEHDAAGMDLSVWGPRTPGKGVRCIGIQLKSVRERFALPAGDINVRPIETPQQSPSGVGCHRISERR